MEIVVKKITSNENVLDSARMTVWKDSIGKEPSDKFMYDIYFSEHSPIRDAMFSVSIYGIKSWVATHFVRHHVGATPYVSTQRDDRVKSDIPRDDARQGELVNMRITLNAQSFIDVSRKRLCMMSHIETRRVWYAVVDKLKDTDLELYKNCVPNCVYRGGICPEGKNGCRYNCTEDFKRSLLSYIDGHENSYREIM